MLGACVMKIKDSYTAIQNHDIVVMLVGSIVAFVVAMLAIKAFVGFLNGTGSNGSGITESSQAWC